MNEKGKQYMVIDFHGLHFELIEERLLLKKCGNIENPNGYIFVELQIAGENKKTHAGAKMYNSSQAWILQYVSHEMTENKLEIVLKSDKVQTKTFFEVYTDTNAIRIHTEVKNISSQAIVIEEISAFTVLGLGRDGYQKPQNMYLTKFVQSHHQECQPRRISFEDFGFVPCAESQRRLAFANVGSWSTKEELPQGIIEDISTGDFTMFQIESNTSWYYEISEYSQWYYLYLGGANLSFGGWRKELKPNESYKTINVALAFGSSYNDVVAEMTKYRRHIVTENKMDAHLPTIFNEYMHLSWDSPTEENTAKIAPIVAKTGVEYYVIDCGWHNEEPGDEVYPYVGQWKESHVRFPHGIRTTTDYIRSLGMKAGLWIEPEIIGVGCQEMLDYYDDDCFLQRNGKRIAVMNRYFLDYRHPKVRAYMSETIRRMIEDYGADYIKCDYNQDCGIGADNNAFSYGEGLELCGNAFLSWIKEMQERYPNVIFEGCASGGMRMDYKSLSSFSLMSTSDQIDCYKYPYIAGNILSAVMPEQAAVWSYPVGVEISEYSEEWIKENIDVERVALNMINSFLGRMHLASHIELLNEKSSAVLKEGIDCYKKLSEIKKETVPYFPNGFTRFGEKQVAAGLKYKQHIYLAVWNLNGELSIRIPFNERIKTANVYYPKCLSSIYRVEDNCLVVDFSKKYQARFFEVELED